MNETTPQNPPSRLIGYARVSTVGQTLDVQLDQLRAAGCRTIFQEKVSGTKSDRKELARMLKGLQPGDVVVVTKLDRLARSIFDLFSIVKRINDAGARFRSIAQEWADTGSAQGRMMLAVMGGMAEVEREMILTRTAEGKARKKARGELREGRPPKLNAAQRQEALARLADGETLVDVARTFDVSHSTIQRLKPK